MTIEMMRFFGASIRWKENSILVEQGNYKAKNFNVESDWSAASYWYSFVALAKEANITLYGLKKEESMQGDAVVSEIYKNFGVETEFFEKGIRLTKSCSFDRLRMTTFDFVNFPDIAQTVAVTCAALNVKARLTGLKTLRIKETDRIAAIQTELTSLGFNVEVDGDDLIVLSSLRGTKQSSSSENEITSFVMKSVKTYNDHRMAMAFAPLALLGEITIEDENVVTKSYPNFWEDLKMIGVND